MWFGILIVFIYCLLIFPILFLYRKQEKVLENRNNTIQQLYITIDKLQSNLFSKEERIEFLENELRKIAKTQKFTLDLNTNVDYKRIFDDNLYSEFRISFEPFISNYLIDNNIYNEISLDFSKMIAEESVNKYIDELIKRLTIQIYNARR